MDDMMNDTVVSGSQSITQDFPLYAVAVAEHASDDSMARCLQKENQGEGKKEWKQKIVKS